MCTSHVVTAIYQFVKLQVSLQSCVRFFEITDVNMCSFSIVFLPLQGLQWVTIKQASLSLKVMKWLN